MLPENGVRVFDDAGNPVPFQFHDNYSLSIAPAPKAKAFDIYFGFKEKQPADTWKPESGVRPPAQRLLLAFYWGGNRPCTPEEFLDWRNREIERQNQWHDNARNDFQKRDDQRIHQHLPEILHAENVFEIIKSHPFGGEKPFHPARRDKVLKGDYNTYHRKIGKND